MTNLERYKEYFKEGTIKYFAVDKDSLEVMNCNDVEECYNCLFHTEEICWAYEDRVKWLLKEAEPIVDWTKIEIDTPVLFRSGGSEKWHKGHYAGHICGDPYVWAYGHTSWTVKELVGVSDRFKPKYIKLSKEGK